MKKLLIISALAASLAGLAAGCTAPEDNSVKEAPSDVPTATADQIAGGKQKAGGEDGVRSSQ